MSEERDKKPGLVPRLRFPEFREAGEWIIVTVGDFFDLTDKPEKISIFDKNKVLTVKLHAKGVVKSEKTTLSGGANYFTRKAGQFIFSKIDLLNGAFGVVPDELDGFVSSSDVPAYSFDAKHSSGFFVNWLKANYERLTIERTGTSSTLKRVSPETFLALPIPSPTLMEQRKIADCLSSLDEKIAAATQKLDVLKTHKKGLMQQLFPAEGETVPRLRFPEFREAGEWEEHEIGSLSIKVGSGITPLGGDKNYKTEGRIFVRSQNIGWGELLLEDVVFIDEEIHATFGATEIKEFDVLLNITGASIGRSAVADSRIAGGNVNQHVCIIRVVLDKLNPFFLNQFLISGRGQKQIDSFQAGGNRQGLNFSQIRSLKIPIPPIRSEQQKIADFLTSLDDLIAAQAQKIELLKRHKKGLMQQLFPVLDEAAA